MKRIVISTAVLALACAGLSTASAAPSVIKVTGGGQIVEAGATGAGNTIAFTAQAGEADGSDAKGQVQYVDRSAGTGQAQQKFHGYVTCVTTANTDVNDDGDLEAIARIQGQMRGEADTTPVDFTIDLIDNGQGAAAEMDMLSFRKGAPTDSEDEPSEDCNTEDDFMAEGGLGRGNVKIHKAKGGSAGGDTETQGGGKGGGKGKPGLAL